MKKYKTVDENAVLINPPKGKVLTVKEVMEGRNSKFEFIDFEEGEPYQELIKESKKVWKEFHPNPIEMALFGAKWESSRKRKKIKPMERVEWIAMMHKQNLNGRETEDELFEAGILAGIEETEAIMYSEEEVLDLLYKRDLYIFNRNENKELELPVEWFKHHKKK